MSDLIKKALIDNFPLTITSKLCQAILGFCYAYETKGTHPEALNTPMLGIAKIYFLESDIQTFFNIFDMETLDVRRLHLEKFMNGLSQSDLKKILYKLEVEGTDKKIVDTDRKVASDPFNIFIIYVIYCVLSSKKINKSEKEITSTTLLKILQYKFFTSLIFQRFSLGANPAIMQATIESLTNKHDIVKYGTWKKVIEVRAEELTSSSSIHYNTFTDFNDDGKIFYAITDLQTRTRNQINIITRKYYELKDKGIGTGTYSTIGSDVDGKKVITNTLSTLDAMVSNVSSEILNTRQFIDQELIKYICSLFKGLHSNMFRLVLEYFSQLAVDQVKSGDSEKIIYIKKEPRYIGSVALISNLIQKSYRHCIQSKTNMNNKVQILRTVKDAYSSSRIVDPDIVNIRESVGLVIRDAHVTTRTATVASLKIAFVLYIIVRSFSYI